MPVDRVWNLEDEDDDQDVNGEDEDDQIIDCLLTGGDAPI